MVIKHAQILTLSFAALWAASLIAVLWFVKSPTPNHRLSFGAVSTLFASFVLLMCLIKISLNKPSAPTR
jgi:multisubunit Na+/H+ antiporter MnhF subunit